MAGTRGRTLEVQYNPMPNGGFATTYTDISERKVAEQTLRDSEAKMRLITDALPALIACADNQQIYRCQSGCRLVWHPAQQNQQPPHARSAGPAPVGRRHYVERALEDRASVLS